MEILAEDKSIARLLGGGATSEVVLPFAVPRQQAEKVKRGGTILFVEDEDSIREMTAMYLQAEGYSVLAATNGTEAVVLWEKHGGEICLVLTDVIMSGGLNGHQLVERLHGDRPDLKVIFVSGYSCDFLGEETFLDETTSFVQKPYRLKNLADMVHDCIGGDNAQGAALPAASH